MRYKQLSSLSFPFILTAHGFRKPLSSYGRSELWQRLAPIMAGFEARGLTVFLTSGALLGLFRDGKLLDSDDDIDILVFQAEGDIEVNAELHLNLERQFPELCWNVNDDVSHKSFSIGDGFPLIDVFPAWAIDRSQTFVYPAGAIDNSSLFPQRPFRDCGYDLPIPSNPEVLLELLYGSWRTPDLAFKFNWRHRKRRGHLVAYGRALQSISSN